MTSQRGFSLIEVVVIIAVLTAMTALVVPRLAALAESDNARATRAQAERIFNAIYGDPADGEFGYLGDMGRLPATLTELVEQGSQTAFHTQDGSTQHVGNIGTGWRGPYLRDFFSTADLLRDAWGTAFTFSNGQVTSGGPDGQVSTTADNIVYPVYQPPTTGTVFFSVLVNRIPDPLGATAKLYSTTNGEQVGGTIQKHLTTSTDFDGFILESVPHGLHVVRVQHTAAPEGGACITVTRYVPVAVYAGQQVVRDVRMESSADVKVTENTCTIPD